MLVIVLFLTEKLGAHSEAKVVGGNRREGC
jgi:hypothetical protein